MKFLKKAAALIAALTLSFSAAAVNVHAISDVKISYIPTVSADTASYFPNNTEAGVYVREHLKLHTSVISVTIPRSTDILTPFNEIMASALSDTGMPDEGDYLRLSIKGYSVGYSTTKTTLTLMITPSYCTTAEQEAQVAPLVEAAIASLELDGKSDYEKIMAIYKFIAKQAVYAEDISDNAVFSAYGVLVNKVAVCQGFAQLLYRMLTEAGISCRTVNGTSQGVDHVWNIAEINGYYYCLDVTWDSNFKGRQLLFFLRGSEDFDTYAQNQPHITSSGDPDNYGFCPDYTSEEFTADFPIAPTAYSPSSPLQGYVLGDVNCDGQVNGKDATDILGAYANLSSELPSGLSVPKMRAADVNSDGFISATDATLVLSYYAYLSSEDGNLSLEEYINTL